MAGPAHAWWRLWPLIGGSGARWTYLEAAEVVLADGRTVVAKSDGEEELFWTLRGGGGNFGVVTTMRLKLHRLPSVRSGRLISPVAEAKAVLEGCAEISRSAPEELTSQVGLAGGPDGVPMVMVVPTWCGPPEEGEARLAAFFQLGTVLMSTVETTPYGTSLTVFDKFLVYGQRYLIETCSLPAFDSRSVDAFIEAMETAVSPGCAVFTHEFKGAAARVPEGVTAFGLRRDHVLVEIIAWFADGLDYGEEERHRQWARATRATFDAIALPGGYPNLLADDDPNRVARSYGRNAGRLIRAKRRYDPDNVFRSAIPLPVASAMAGAS